MVDARHPQSVLRGSEIIDEDMTAYIRAADAIREAFALRQLSSFITAASKAVGHAAILHSRAPRMRSLPSSATATVGCLSQSSG